MFSIFFFNIQEDEHQQSNWFSYPKISSSKNPCLPISSDNRRSTVFIKRLAMRETHFTRLRA